MKVEHIWATVFFTCPWPILLLSFSAADAFLLVLYRLTSCLNSPPNDLIVFSEHLIEGSVLLIGSIYPSRSDPNAYWKPRAPNRGFRFTPPTPEPRRDPLPRGFFFPTAASGSVTLQSMPWDVRSEAAKERIIAFGIVLVLLVVAVLFALAYFGMEFIENALR
jgi:hypothetical protein